MKNYEKFLVYDLMGNYVSYGILMMKNYFQLVVSKPGRYLIMRENTKEI